MPAPKPMSLFIANRGEIARRIASTARRLGIETIALTDRATPPAYLTDVVTKVVTVAEETTALYLDGPRLVKLAKENGATAVHPGFGFLSENAGFAAAVEDAGLTWVGPNPKAIDAMASKASARERAERAGVPCIEGLTGFSVPADEKGDFSELESFAKKVGYPLLLKAALGGGGKGMRVASNAQELRSGALRARSEAIQSFGDGALICERYLGAPRHVEVQILADKKGGVVAVGDRDCSLQRRHQKIVEEAPAPNLGPKTRAAMHAAAVRLAAEVGYDSTGTVEFLVDWSPAAQKSAEQSFFFLEMNTRLQVEHPVTEEVYGLDLVEWQLRVARGETLPQSFKALTPRGASVEARFYAEDPRQGFFPAPGPVAAFKPALGPGLRWEVGLDDGDEITGRFDPMIAKLIATGATREIALERLAEGLTRTFYAGPPSNLELLVELARDPEFSKAPVTTHWLGATMPSLLERLEKGRKRYESTAEALFSGLSDGSVGGGGAHDAAGLNGKIEAGPLTQAIFGGGQTKVPQDSPATRTSGERSATSDGGRAVTRSGIGWTAEVTGFGGTPGSTIPFHYAARRGPEGRRFWVTLGGISYVKDLPTSSPADRRAGGAKGGAGAEGGDVRAPVPGKVVSVLAKAAEPVQPGDTLVVLESMKMEFEVKATRSGKVALNVKPGDQVVAGQTLATWTANASN